MKSDMEAVYFLTVREAEEIAEQHEDDEDWELWGDTEAIYLGEMKGQKATSTSARMNTNTNGQTVNLET